MPQLHHGAAAKKRQGERRSLPCCRRPRSRRPRASAESGLASAQTHACWNVSGKRLHSPLAPGHIFQPHLSPLDARALTHVSRAAGAQYVRTQTFFWCPEPSSCNNDVFSPHKNNPATFPSAGIVPPGAMYSAASDGTGQSRRPPGRDDGACLAGNGGVPAVCLPAGALPARHTGKQPTVRLDRAPLL